MGIDKDRGDFTARVRGVASLAEPVRRALYRFVTAERRPVSRDEAAAGVGVARHAAKFHLDRMVDDGLLAAEYSRPPGRGGPGAGRPAKRYRRADAELAVSVPERRYDVAAALLAEAVDAARSEGVTVEAALDRAARAEGAALAAMARAHGAERGGDDHADHPGADPDAAHDATARVLAERGYEPSVEGDDLILGNCPFHALVDRHRDLVCGLNLSLLDAVLDGLGDHRRHAVLDPAPGRCCVRLRAT